MKGRWHDNRHTLVTELAESGAGDEVIMSIAGHVSRAMLSRYSHVRMEAKRRALDEIAARQRAADEKRKADAERQQGCGGLPVGGGSVILKASTIDEGVACQRLGPFYESPLSGRITIRQSRRGHLFRHVKPGQLEKFKV